MIDIRNLAKFDGKTYICCISTMEPQSGIDFLILCLDVVNSTVVDRGCTTLSPCQHFILCRFVIIIILLLLNVISVQVDPEITEAILF